MSMEPGWHSSMSDTTVVYIFDGDIVQRVDRGNALMKQNHFLEAIAEFDAVLETDRENYYANWNRTVCLLSLGDYKNGLPLHDTAWGVYGWGKGGPVNQGLAELPVWKGERCRLIVYHNMGFGDAIMCLRFLPEIVARCESVTLVVRKELISLFEGYGASIVNRIPDISQFDARVTLFNSIFTMGHSEKTIPSSSYIPAKFKLTGGKMGIAWSGFTRRELDSTSFLAKLNTNGFDLYSLQKTVEHISNITSLFSKDFKDTIKLITTLDCIVTVDTAVAHLAGAMGHPNTHVLMPHFRDWRWWRKDIWYPSLNIYPQDDSSDWDAPFQRVNEAIKKL